MSSNVFDARKSMSSFGGTVGPHRRLLLMCAQGESCLGRLSALIRKIAAKWLASRSRPSTRQNVPFVSYS